MTNSYRPGLKKFDWLNNVVLGRCCREIMEFKPKNQLFLKNEEV